MRTVTITDVAEHAGVSKSTVSQFLNKRYDYMAKKTKEKIELAIEELGYRPNIVARSLKQKSTTTIGVIVANILHEFSTQIIRAIEDFCHELDFHIIVCNADDDPEKEKKYIDMLRAKQIDGIIIFPTGDNVELYKRMIMENYPIVFLDRHVPELAISSILLDNEKASSLAIEEFVRNGYERIGIVTTSTFRNITPRIERISGYKKAIEAHGLPMEDEYIKSAEIHEIQSDLQVMVSLPNPPQAILAGNDLALIEILKYTKENQMKIPEDLALIGIDDVSFAGIYHPSITTIAQPTFDMGKRAAKVLLDKITNKDSREEVANIDRFKPRLIVRVSSSKT
ncbi:LacI family transcriptional regulator [Lentibacillus populi]|uniref:LacI family transcriptional regulator n=1 Tax=Lentibacillus populi TaxID=1827502 RepID=A0A9W5TYP0_9BACI|nr:substrate-binding domain-containing protein [Lentibacillus populi]GGB45860.1 LacI family transcriptional regulator [Lentibacillus populi]